MFTSDVSQNIITVLISRLKMQKEFHNILVSNLLQCFVLMHSAVGSHTVNLITLMAHMSHPHKKSHNYTDLPICNQTICSIISIVYVHVLLLELPTTV